MEMTFPLSLVRLLVASFYRIVEGLGSLRPKSPTKPETLPRSTLRPSTDYRLLTPGARVV